QQPPLFHHAPVDLRLPQILTLAGWRIVVTANEDQWRGVGSGQRVEIVRRQVAAADHQVDATLRRYRPLIEQLGFNLVADRLQAPDPGTTDVLAGVPLFGA